MLELYFLITMLFSLAIGSVLTRAVDKMIERRRHRALPAATVRELKRDACRHRRELSDFSHVRPAREVGVRVFDRREYDLPRLGEPPTFLPDVQAFDEESTRG